MLATLLLYKSHDNETGWSRRRGSVVVRGTLAFGRWVEKEEEDREGEGGREDIKKASPRVSARLLSSCRS